MEENLFRSIPRVDELLGRDELKVSALPPVLLRESVREELDALRDEVRSGLSRCRRQAYSARAFWHVQRKSSCRRCARSSTRPA